MAVWDYSTGCVIKGYRGGSGIPRGLHASPEIVACAQLGKPAVHFWQNGSEQLHLKVSLAEKLTAFSISSDDVHCVGATASGKLMCWELATGRLVGVVSNAHYRRIGE